MIHVNCYCYIAILETILLCEKNEPSQLKYVIQKIVSILYMFNMYV